MKLIPKIQLEKILVDYYYFKNNASSCLIELQKLDPNIRDWVKVNNKVWLYTSNRKILYTIKLKPYEGYIKK